ncbi:MAG TPA: Rap1a/Tai family immunity protein [Caulobacteraceae bacterium]|nr:Rap1a/Tai family immunity protein [Caulobacteraceae bacterium]
MILAATPMVVLSLITAPPAPTPAVSGFMNSERLIDHCRPNAAADASMADVCIGYIAGSVDQVLSRQAELPPNKRRVCLAPTTTLGEVQRAVLANLEDYEDQPNAAAAVIIERSLMAAFPC